VYNTPCWSSDVNFCGCEAGNLTSLNLAEYGRTVADLVSGYNCLG
jgi:hypothetical protein